MRRNNYNVTTSLSNCDTELEYSNTYLWHEEDSLRVEDNSIEACDKKRN
jgi:hypothetical protein